MDPFSIPGTKVTDGGSFLKHRAFVPRYRCFSLGDFKEFDKCAFSFFVKHHLQKKYDLSEGSANQALGSLLDISIKKIHEQRLYDQPVEVLLNVVKASELEMRSKAKSGKDSFYSAQIPFLTEELIIKAQQVLSAY